MGLLQQVYFQLTPIRVSEKELYKRKVKRENGEERESGQEMWGRKGEWVI